MQYVQIRGVHRLLLRLYLDYLDLVPNRHIYFFTHQHGKVAHHPWARLDVSEKPDVLGTLKYIFDDYSQQPSNKSKVGNYINFSYLQVESCVEVFSKGTSAQEGAKQAALYATSIHHVRLDKPCAYGLYAAQNDYHIIWSDPVATYRSPLQLYSEPGALIRYIASLYNAPLMHPTSSAKATLAGFSMSQNIQVGPIGALHLTPRSGDCTPLWNITGLDGSFHCIFSGIPHTRCMCVYTQVDPPQGQKAPFIYKRVMGRLEGLNPVHREVEMLQHIHQDGYVRGIVRGFEFDEDPITINISMWDSTELNVWNHDEEHVKVASRRSSSMVYLDTGTLISKGKTVLDLLSGFFDIVEGA